MTNVTVPGERLAQEWRDPLARVGLVAKGVLYLILGLLAIQFARGDASSDEVSEAGAFEKLAEQPFGKFLLAALVVGLAALTIWHVIQAFTGDPVEGDEATDKLKYAGKAITYGVLTFSAFKIAKDSWSGGAAQAESGNEQNQQAASFLFDLPGGAFLVGLLGVVLLCIAAYQFYKYVYNTEHMERIAPPGQTGSTLRMMGRIGYFARGTVVAISGIFFIVAAVQHDPNESKGISGALAELAQNGWGRIVLWFVAIGLALFGIFCFAEAKYRRAT